MVIVSQFIHGTADAITKFGNSAIGLAIVGAVVPDMHIIGSATCFHFVETVRELYLAEWAAGWEVGGGVEVGLVEIIVEGLDVL